MIADLLNKLWEEASDDESYPAAIDDRLGAQVGQVFRAEAKRLSGQTSGEPKTNQNK